MVAKLRSLPVVSRTYKDLIRALEDEECELHTVSEIIERDVGLSTKLLQMVNSAFFGLPRKVEHVRDAVSLVGLMNVRHLTVTTNVFDALAADDEAGNLISALWNASIDIGSLSCELARSAGRSREVCEAARLAGTVSLIGRAVLIRSSFERYAGVREVSGAGANRLADAERAEYGAAQHAVGAYALGLWAFADPVVESVLGQEAPAESGVSSADHPLAYVHMARSRTRVEGLIDETPLDTAWLASIGIDGAEMEQLGSAA